MGDLTRGTCPTSTFSTLGVMGICPGRGGTKEGEGPEREGEGPEGGAGAGALLVVLLVLDEPPAPVRNSIISEAVISFILGFLFCCLACLLFCCVFFCLSSSLPVSCVSCLCLCCEEKKEKKRGTKTKREANSFGCVVLRFGRALVLLLLSNLSSPPCFPVSHAFVLAKKQKWRSHP